jgi:MFS family permease
MQCSEIADQVQQLQSPVRYDMILPMNARDEFSRGWRTLLACSLGNGSGLSGIPFFTFGVFVLPLVSAFGWQRGDVASAASFLILGTAITAPVVGAMIDRFGAYRVSLISFVLLSIGYYLLTKQSGAIAMFYACWLALSLVGGGTTPVVWTRAVNLWFDRGRGLALGIALAGSGLSGVLAPPLMNRAIETWGWQGGYIAIALYILVIALPLIALLYKDRPAVTVDTLGMTSAVAEPPGMTLREALHSPAFWKIALGFIAVSGVIAGTIINLVPLLVDRGLARSSAASVAGIMGIAVLLGRVGIGFLLDRLSAPKVATVLLLLCGAGCFMLSRADTPAWAITLCVVALGLGAAAEVDLVAYLTSRYLGMKAYGRIYGLQLTSFYIGAAVGPAAFGKSFDFYQSYVPALYFATGALIFGAIVVGTLGKPPDFGGRH